MKETTKKRYLEFISEIQRRSHITSTQLSLTANDAGIGKNYIKPLKQMGVIHTASRSGTTRLYQVNQTCDVDISQFLDLLLPKSIKKNNPRDASGVQQQDPTREHLPQDNEERPSKKEPDQEQYIRAEDGVPIQVTKRAVSPPLPREAFWKPILEERKNQLAEFISYCAYESLPFDELIYREYIDLLNSKKS